MGFDVTAIGSYSPNSSYSRVAEETHWDFSGGRIEVPWHAPVNSRAQLPRFFEHFGSSVEVNAFEPREFMHCGPHVLVDVHIEYTVCKESAGAKDARGPRGGR